MPPPRITKLIHLSPSFPISPPTTHCASQDDCAWWPYSNSNTFESKAFFVLFVLFFSLIGLLALVTSIRCYFRHIVCRHDGLKPASNAAKATAVAAPTTVYVAGMKIAGEEADCAICLTEFQEGEEVRVLENCMHGFHVGCIEKWILEKCSCPTCRMSCLVKEVKIEKEVKNEEV